MLELGASEHKSLEEIFGLLIKTDPTILTGYLEDASGYTLGQAERLVIPENTEELAAYLQAASQQSESITLVGGRTGVTAGCIAQGGTLLSLERLANLGQIELLPGGAKLRVQTAVRLETLKTFTQSQGWYYGPDPTELTGSLGGNVATNASGGRSFKYGSTRHHILGLTLILATGEKLHLNRGQCFAQGDHIRLPLASGRILEFKRPLLPGLAVSKNAAGYYSTPNMDVLDLFIGMEGTLGVITDIIVQLLPAPFGAFTLAVFFSDPAMAFQCSTAIREARYQPAPRAGIDPAAIEYMDVHSLDLLRPDFPNLPNSARAVLLIDQEYTRQQAEAALKAWEDFLQPYQIPENMIWFADDYQDQARLRAFRHALPEAINTKVRQYHLPKVGTDMAVPPECFPRLIKTYQEGLPALGLEYFIFGHIGECHLHVNVLPKNSMEHHQAKQLYLSFAQEAVACGGTVSAEHGIGKIKHDFLKLMVGEAGLREMARIKRVLDPAGILNRGNIFPEKYLLTSKV